MLQELCSIMLQECIVLEANTASAIAEGLFNEENTHSKAGWTNNTHNFDAHTVNWRLCI